MSAAWSLIAFRTRFREKKLLGPVGIVYVLVAVLYTYYAVFDGALLRGWGERWDGGRVETAMGRI